MQTKKIFLASSSELQEDRKEFEIFLNRKNNDWVEKGVFLKLIVWEDFLDAVAKTRLQDEYNQAIRECDVFVMLFFTKVGKYTAEEFETAFGQFKATNKPFIFTYFKDAPISTGSADEDDLTSLFAFKKKLKALGHFVTVYQNIDTLKFHFNQQLDKLAASGFIEFKPDQEAAARGTTYQATLTGSGAISQGGGPAVGERGVYVGGQNTGSINTGTQTNIDTGGGAYIGGDVNTVGSKFVGRDDHPLAAPPAADTDRLAPSGPEKAPPAAPDLSRPDWRQALQEELERLPLGLVMFNPPGRMKLGKAERVEVRITQDPGQDLVRALKGRGLPQIEAAKVGSLMKVRLTGEAFSIQALNEEAQVIPAHGYTEWAWDVVPVQSGTRTLHLHVTVRIRLPHGEERKDHPVVDRIIQVDVDSIYSIKKWIADHWQWLLGTLVIPLIAWIWAKLQS